MSDAENYNYFQLKAGVAGEYLQFLTIEFEGLRQDARRMGKTAVAAVAASIGALSWAFSHKFDDQVGIGINIVSHGPKWLDASLALLTGMALISIVMLTIIFWALLAFVPPPALNKRPRSSGEASRWSQWFDGPVLSERNQTEWRSALEVMNTNQLALRERINTITYLVIATSAVTLGILSFSVLSAWKLAGQ